MIKDYQQQKTLRDDYDFCIIGAGPAGITLGLAQFMQSRMAILLATGTKKALIIKKALTENVSASIPASFIQEHSNSFVLLDNEAAALLNA